MERVQITGQAGDGQYYDNKGRLLYAMGDINITPGMWVWTNGKTIYGHTTAGNEPITHTFGSVLPIVSNYGIFEILPNGNITPFVNMYIRAYVGDSTHAYIGVYNSNEYYALDWYNVLTGKKIGTFAADDACIDAKTGDLLTVETDEYTEYKEVNNCKTFMKIDNIFPPISERVAVVNKYSETELKAGNGNSANTSKIILRRNGKIEKNFLPILRNYLNEAIKESKATAAKIHDSHGSDNVRDCFSIRAEGRLWGEFSKGNFPRPRPNKGAYNGGIRVTAMRIYSNNNIFVLANNSATSNAYPCITNWSWKLDVIDPVRTSPYSEKRIVKKHIPWGALPKGAQNDATEYNKYIGLPDLRQYAFYDVDDRTAVWNLYKTVYPITDWMAASVYVNSMIEIKDGKAHRLNHALGIYINNVGRIPVFGKMIYETAALIPPYTIDILPEYGIKGVVYCSGKDYVYDIDRTAVSNDTAPMFDFTPEQWQTLYKATMGSFPGLYYINASHYQHSPYPTWHFITAPTGGLVGDYGLAAKKWAEAGGVNSYYKADKNETEVSCELINGFHATAVFNDFQSVVNVKIQDADKKPVNLPDSGAYALWNNWYGIKARKLKKDTVLFTTYGRYNNDSLVIFANNSGTKYFYQHGTFTLTPFRNRTLLKRRLEALLKRIQGAGGRPAG